MSVADFITDAIIEKLEAGCIQLRTLKIIKFRHMIQFCVPLYRATGQQMDFNYLILHLNL